VYVYVSDYCNQELDYTVVRGSLATRYPPMRTVTEKEKRDYRLGDTEKRTRVRKWGSYRPRMSWRGRVTFTVRGLHIAVKSTRGIENQMSYSINGRETDF